jgi:hypothetical protein
MARQLSFMWEICFSGNLFCTIFRICPGRLRWRLCYGFSLAANILLCLCLFFAAAGFEILQLSGIVSGTADFLDVIFSAVGLVLFYFINIFHVKTEVTK